MSCGVGRRCDSDPALLWLWCRPAAAARIQALAWELPQTEGLALKRPNRQTKPPTTAKNGGERKGSVHLPRETVLQGLKRPPTFSLILYMQMPSTLKHGKKQNTFIPVPSEELNLKQAGLLVKPSQAASSSAVPPPHPHLV